MSFKDLIPAEFFVKPPEPPKPPAGAVILQNSQIIVRWDRSCPCFDKALAAARDLKSQGFGGYTPSSAQWQFNQTAAAKVIAAYDPLNFAITDEVRTLALKPIAPQKHGAVTLQGNQYLVVWGNPPYHTTQVQFQDYLTAARNIKASF